MNTTAIGKLLIILYLVVDFLFHAQINSKGHVEPKPQFQISFKRLEKPRLEPKNLGIQVDSLTTTPEKLIAVGPVFDTV